MGGTMMRRLDILSRCEDMLSDLNYDMEYLKEYFSKYEHLQNHLDAIDRAIVKVEKIQEYYEAI